MLTHAFFRLSPRGSQLRYASSSSLLRSLSRIHTVLAPLPDLHQRSSLGRPLSQNANWREVIGIDFGTTNSRAAIMEKNGNPKVIEIADQKRSIPSVVAFDEEGREIVGASSTDVENGKATVYGIKRLIGRSYVRHSKQLEKLKKIVPYEIIPPDSDEEDEDEDESKVRVKLADGSKYSPTKIASFIIKKLMEETAKSRRNILASHAVICVPPFFERSSKSALRKAAQHPGVDVELLDEHLAASLYYMTKRRRERRLAVVDFGGGSFDISIVEAAYDGNGEPSLQRIATESCDSVSGLEFDYAVMDLLKKKLEKGKGGNVRQCNLSAYSSLLWREAERAKIELSSSPAFYSSDLEVGLERSEFEDSMEGMMMKVEDLCWSCLKKMDRREVDEVILIGGMTRVPRIRKLVEDVFEKKPSQEDEAVALGAAIKANFIARTS